MTFQSSSEQDLPIARENYLRVLVLQPLLDHVVIDTRDAIDDALARFTSVGFAMTERGRHTLGSVNHLAVFASDYLELLGWEPGAAMTRSELLAYPPGLNGLVFRTENAAQLFEVLRARGLPALEPLAFARPVRSAGGALAEARFRTVRFEPGTFGATRVYFCEHLTPELVWQTSSPAHRNGARDIVRAVYAGGDAATLAPLLAAIFGEGCVRRSGDRVALDAANAQVEIGTTAAPALVLRSANPGRTQDALGVRLEFVN